MEQNPASQARFPRFRIHAVNASHLGQFHNPNIPRLSFQIVPSGSFHHICYRNKMPHERDEKGAGLHHVLVENVGPWGSVVVKALRY
jgi:hypothetical protein